jgi:hypothetical protein
MMSLVISPSYAAPRLILSLKPLADSYPMSSVATIVRFILFSGIIALASGWRLILLFFGFHVSQVVV